MREQTQESSPLSMKRRHFLGGAGAAAAVSAVGGIGTQALAHASEAKISGGTSRSITALNKRVDRAIVNLTGAVAEAHGNGDEQDVPDFLACYSKGLPHNALGEVDRSAYAALALACQTNTAEHWAAVPMGGSARLVSPQAGFAYQMEGEDPTRMRIAAAPKFISEQRSAEMAEVYWMALLREVPFADYPTNILANEAVSDLRRFELFKNLTVENLFRGLTVGERKGPYLSQFLVKDVPFGAGTIVQRYAAGTPGINFGTTVEECVRLQNGLAPSRTLALGNATYLRNGRDLSEYVHKDFSYQAFLNASLIALSYGSAALDAANPYKGFGNRGAFVNFGGPDILSMVAQVSLLALRAAWHQKWAIQRNLRPEVMALRVHQQLANVRRYGIHEKLLASPVLEKIQASTRSALLPLAYAEGSPNHPTYVSGHATISGACVTVMKAFFDENFVIPDAVVPGTDGQQLRGAGIELTLGGELDKLAANVSIGRNIAGVHYWSDAIEGMNLGEQVAISYLDDLRGNYTEGFAGFSLTKFNGEKITLTG